MPETRTRVTFPNGDVLALHSDHAESDDGLRIVLVPTVRYWTLNDTVVSRAEAFALIQRFMDPPPPDPTDLD